MNINSEYCASIEYKKNSLESLSSFLKYEKHNKKILLLCDNTINVKKIVNCLEKIKSQYQFIVISKFLENADKEILIKETQKCDLIVCCGGREIVNNAKMLSFMERKELLIIAVDFCLDYFNKYFFDKNYIYREELKRAKVYIDEQILFELPENLYRDGILSILSYYEYYLSLCFEQYFDNTLIDTKEFYSLLRRAEILYDALDDQSNRLELMDIIIEMGYILQNTSPNQISFINFANIINIEDSFGKKSIITSNLLINAYKNFFCQEIIAPIKYPNILYYCEKIKMKRQKDLDYVSSIINDTNLNNKLNFYKNDFAAKLSIKSKYIFSNHYNHIDKKLYYQLKALPFVFENSRLLDIVGNYGAFCF